MAEHACQLHRHLGCHAVGTATGDASHLLGLPADGEQGGSSLEVGQGLLVEFYLVADGTVLDRTGLDGTLAVDGGDGPMCHATDEVALSEDLVGFLFAEERLALAVHVVDHLVDVVEAVVEGFPGEAQAFVAVVVVRVHDEVGIGLELLVGAFAPSLVAAQQGMYLEPAAEISRATPGGIGGREALVVLFGSEPERLRRLHIRVVQVEPAVTA